MLKRISMINTREDAAHYIETARLLAAGGKKAVEDRKNRSLELEKLGDSLFESGHFEGALSALMEACEISGAKITCGMVQLIAKCFLEMGRGEEAVIYASLNERIIEESKGDIASSNVLLARCFYEIGYVDLANSLLVHCGEQAIFGPGLKYLTDEDLESTFERLFSSDKTSQEEELAFLFIHLTMHLRDSKRQKEVSRTIEERFAIRLDEFVNNNAILQSILVSSRPLTDFKLVDFAILLVFLKCFDQISACCNNNKKFLSETFKWHDAFLQSFAQRLVLLDDSQQNCNFAFHDHSFAGFIICNWFKKVVDGKISAKFAPFTSFKWQASLLYLFSTLVDWHGTELVPESAVSAEKLNAMNKKMGTGNKFGPNQVLISLLLDLISGTSGFFENAIKLPLEDWTKAIDLLTLVSAINFSEWKTTCAVVSTCNEAEEGSSKRMTDKVCLSFLMVLWKKLFENVEPARMPLLILNQPSIFVHLAGQLLFCAENLAHLNDSGLRVITNVIITLSHAICLQSNRAGHVEPLTKCAQFCQRFCSAVPLILTHQYKKSLDICRQVFIDSVISMIAFLCTASPSFAFSSGGGQAIFYVSAIYNQEFFTWSPVSSIIKLHKVQSLCSLIYTKQNFFIANAYRFLAIILRSNKATFETSFVDSYIALDLFSILCKRLMRVLDKQEFSTIANLLLVLTRFIDDQNPLVTPGSGRKITNFGGLDRNQLLLKLTTLVKVRSDGPLCKDEVAFSRNVSVVSVERLATSIASGCFVAALVKFDFNCGDFLLKSCSHLRDAIKSLKKRIVELEKAVHSM